MSNVVPMGIRLDESKLLGARIGALGTKIGFNLGIPVPVQDETTSTPFNTADPIQLKEAALGNPGDQYHIDAFPTHGTLSNVDPSTGQVTTPNATVVYTPNAGYSGPDSFTYDAMTFPAFKLLEQVRSAIAVAPTTGTVSITVGAGTPTANPQSVSGGFNVPDAITLTGSDPDVPALAQTFAIATGPTNGTLTGFNAATGAVTYVPNPGYHGADSFTFTDSNGTNTSAPAAVTLAVAAGTPTANGQSTTTAFNTPDPITLTASDPDAPALAQTFAIATGPANGTLTGFNPATGAVVYVPNPGFQGADSFTFTDSNGTNTSTPAAVAVSVAAPPDTVPPTVTFDPTVGFDGSTGFTLSGTATDASGIASVVVSAEINGGARATIGNAAVGADGRWTLNDDVGPVSQSFITATATDGAGNTAVAPSFFDLTAGVQHDLFVAYQDSYNTSGNFTGQTFFKSSGGVLFYDTYQMTPDGGQAYTYSGGSFFDNKPYSSFTDTYTADGDIQLHHENNRDGSITLVAETSGRVDEGPGSETFTRGGNHDTFVFAAGLGHVTIDEFQAIGAKHDVLSLPAADLANLGQIISQTKTKNGNTTIQLSATDSVTLTGVTKAELKAHPQDFKLHA